MGLLRLTYLFPNEPPTVLTLLEHLTYLAAEALQFDDGELQCPVIDDCLWLFPVEESGQRGYTISTIALRGSYLLDALISVLRAAGGSGPAPRNDVSGQSWQQAQALYPTWSA